MNGARATAIKELVRGIYENPQVVSRYVDIGLWPSEETLILEYVPDGGRLLDVGCGAGRASIALAEMGVDVVGIDLSQTMITVARQQADLTGTTVAFEVMDVTGMRFANASFEAALFSYNGLELLPGREGKKSAMEEIGRILKPGGIFIFTTHSLFALNQFAVFRLTTFCRFCAGRLFGLPIKEKELGERFIDDPDEEVKYLQILPPFMLIKMLRASGFELLMFNTRRRIEKGVEWGWRGIFEDGERFYVARKKK